MLQKPNDTMRIPRGEGGGGAGRSKNPMDRMRDPQMLLASADPVQQLQSLLGGGGMTATGPSDMMSEVPLGGNPMLAAIQMAGAGNDPRMRLAMNPLEQGGGRQGMGLNAEELGGGSGGRIQSPMYGEMTDGDIAEGEGVLDDVRGGVLRRPPMDDYATGEDGPRPDPRQTPMPSDQSVPDGPYQPNIGAPGAPGQAVMGAYLNRNKGAKSTEQELEEVQKSMGSSDGPGPVPDGWMTPAIRKKMIAEGYDPDDPEDAKDYYGDGLDEDDDGDHEYR